MSKEWVCSGGVYMSRGYVWGVCPGGVGIGHGTWDRTGYGQQVGGMHSTEMLSCGNYYNCAMFRNFGLLKRARYQNV